MDITTQTIRAIHYGSDRFDKDRFRPIENNIRSLLNKPLGGLWSSPIDARFGWKEYCISEHLVDYSEKYFEFTFKGEVLTIDNKTKLEQLPLTKVGNCYYSFAALDFEAIALKADAISLNYQGLAHHRRAETELNLYWWDCETLLILNPASIQGENLR